MKTKRVGRSDIIELVFFNPIYAPFSLSIPPHKKTGVPFHLNGTPLFFMRLIPVLFAIFVASG